MCKSTGIENHPVEVENVVFSKRRLVDRIVEADAADLVLVAVIAAGIGRLCRVGIRDRDIVAIVGEGDGAEMLVGIVARHAHRASLPGNEPPVWRAQRVSCG